MSKPTPHPAALLMQVRTWHRYVGMLIAPTVLFMAATGLLQIYSLHESHGTYTPPPLIEKLAAVHKDQRFSVERHGPPPTARPKPAPAQSPKEAPQAGEARPGHLATTLLKAFFAAVALGLIGSTLMGLWMALRQGAPRRGMSAMLLLVGVLVPLVLAALTG
jgi:hypothetical protein